MLKAVALIEAVAGMTDVVVPPVVEAGLKLLYLFDASIVFVLFRSVSFRFGIENN